MFFTANKLRSPLPNFISAYFSIVRPLNVLIGFASVYVGAFVAKPFVLSIEVVIACVSASAILAGGNVINDYYDRDLDRVNKAHRPLPAGKIKANAARTFAIILFTFGLFLAIFVSPAALCVASFATVGLYYYSFRLKRTVLWGNLTVSLISALAFIYGGIAADAWTLAITPGGFAFCFHLGREIIKDIEDVDADRTEDASTLPITRGVPFALCVATCVFVTLIVLTFVPFWLNIYGGVYLAIVVPGVDFVIVVLLFLMWNNPLPNVFGRISQVLKIDMFVGLVAVIAGALD